MLPPEVKNMCVYIFLGKIFLCKTVTSEILHSETTEDYHQGGSSIILGKLNNSHSLLGSSNILSECLSMSQMLPCKFNYVNKGLYTPPVSVRYFHIIQDG